jgi:hypothetical protein
MPEEKINKETAEIHISTSKNNEDFKVYHAVVLGVEGLDLDEVGDDEAFNLDMASFLYGRPRVIGLLIYQFFKEHPQIFKAFNDISALLKPTVEAPPEGSIETNATEKEAPEKDEG